MTKQKEWFESWFDSPYYHLLYSKRNQNEANDFIDLLLEELNPASNAVMLDLACGKGRHALRLSQNGYKTTGIDLSENSINDAKLLETSSLSFTTGDMRETHFPLAFDYVFNLFTSFGYFKDIKDNIKTLKSIAKQLKPKGTLVLDYINSEKAIAGIDNSPNWEVIRRDNTEFKVKKHYDNLHIRKEIRIQTQDDRVLRFQETIQRISVNQFTDWMLEAGFIIESVFGSYGLDRFEPKTSPRCIIIARLDK